jgi:hypothetical protein
MLSPSSFSVRVSDLQQMRKPYHFVSARGTYPNVFAATLSSPAALDAVDASGSGRMLSRTNIDTV